jgi:hypothetical protein
MMPADAKIDPPALRPRHASACRIHDLALLQEKQGVDAGMRRHDDGGR